MLIAQGIGGRPSKFLTLTLRRSEARTPIEAAKLLVTAWRDMRLDIMKKRKWQRLEFLAVFEPHVSGWPHLHIILRCPYIDIYWIKEWMEKRFNSFKQDIRSIDQQQWVAAYVAKYCGKGATKFGTCKRYWQSKRFDMRPKPERSWRLINDPFREVLPCTLGTMISVYTKQGWTVHHTAAWKATFRPPPKGASP